MSYSHETICKYLNWIAYTLRIAGRFPSQHVLHQLCRKRWWGHLQVNLQTKPVIYQHLHNKQLFPNSSSSSDMLMQCCIERSAWTLSTAIIHQAVRAYAAAIHPHCPAVLGPFIPRPAWFCIPHSWKVLWECWCQEIFQKGPPNMAGGERWVWEVGDFDDDFFKVFLAVSIFI